MNMEPKFHYTERMVLMKAPVSIENPHKTGGQRDFSQLFGFISYKLYIQGNSHIANG
jgi:hypothetical protein